MRRFTYVLGLSLTLSLLISCAPRATIAKPDIKALSFSVSPTGDLVVAANAPIEYGSVSVAGLKLKLETPYCDLPECAPNENGYIRLTYPDEPEASYGARLQIQVISGVPKQGRALMTLTGEDSSRPALLTIP